MNNDNAFDCSTDEDELMDEELMFFLEQEVETHLTMENGDSSSTRRLCLQREMEAMRPSNPVAQLLETEEEATLPTFGTRPVTMESFRTFSSVATPTQGHAASLCDESPSFEYYNGRRKRKYVDESCCLTPPVRPMAKRAKVPDKLPKLPSLETMGVPSSSLPPLHIVSPTPVATTGFLSPVASTPMAIPTTATQTTLLPSLKIHRSAAIAIAHQSTWPLRATSSSPGARTSKVIRTASDPTSTWMSAPTSSSSSSPLEYFCRRSLDISSPLRTRFRDLVVSSVGRTGSVSSS